MVGACNFHAFMSPGRELAIHVYHPQKKFTPRTSDDRTFDGRSRVFRDRRLSFTIRSLVEATAAPVIPVVQDSFLNSTTRHIMLSSDETAEEKPEPAMPVDLRSRVLRNLRERMPLMYDELRDIELLRHRKNYRRPRERRNYGMEFAPGGISRYDTLHPAGPLREGAPRAILFGLHWFELGGAERWAFETIGLARDAGFVPIVLTSRDSHQEWITRAELTGALLIPMSEPTALSQTPGGEQLMRAILENFDVRGVVVHHNQWLYDRLPFIKASRPNIPTLASVHIVEYRDGGYPASSVMADHYIDVHHVISPSLSRWMIETQEVDENKVVMAPLGGLTVEPTDTSFLPRTADRPFVVSFIGRLARQKAPEVFVEMAALLKARHPDVTFILHGSGEQSQWVDALLDRSGIAGAVERRGGSFPVTRTLEESDLLVITSANEGLTLTTLEAIAAGVPVVSTDVGAQRDIIPAHALVPRNVHRAVRKLADLASELIDNEPARRALWEQERTAEQRLLANESATQWFRKEISAW